MKRIAIDMDEVIADFHPKMVKTWNTHFSQRLAPEELTLFRLPQDAPDRLGGLFERVVSDPTFLAALAVSKTASG